MIACTFALAPTTPSLRPLGSNPPRAGIDRPFAPADRDPSERHSRYDSTRVTRCKQEGNQELSPRLTTSEFLRKQVANIEPRRFTWSRTRICARNKFFSNTQFK